MLNKTPLLSKKKNRKRAFTYKIENLRFIHVLLETYALNDPKFNELYIIKKLNIKIIKTRQFYFCNVHYFEGSFAII